MTRTEIDFLNCKDLSNQGKIKFALMAQESHRTFAMEKAVEIINWEELEPTQMKHLFALSEHSPKVACAIIKTGKFTADDVVNILGKIEGEGFRSLVIKKIIPIYI